MNLQFDAKSVSYKEALGGDIVQVTFKKIQMMMGDRKDSRDFGQ
jgi:hypothetical protein